MNNKYQNDKLKLEELKSKTLFIFDMDGTIYLEDKPLPHAINFVKKIANSSNKHYLYFTNNASKDPEAYIEKLKKIGFPTDTKDTPPVLTSADVLIKFLKLHRQNQSVYLLGTELLENMFIENGINLFYSEENAPHTGHTKTKKDETIPNIVVSSFDTSLTYFKLERACTYIRNGAEWLTTHPDINCPVENGCIPDCGAINELIKASTGKPLPKAFGKPYGEVVEMLEELYNIDRKNMVMFGDRLYTDIALGKNNGMMAVLLLTGEASLQDALNLPPNLQPDLIFETLYDIEL